MCNITQGSISIWRFDCSNRRSFLKLPNDEDDSDNEGINNYYDDNDIFNSCDNKIIILFCVMNLFLFFILLSGSASSGDIDVLMTHPTFVSYNDDFDKVSEGFITGI